MVGNCIITLEVDLLFTVFVVYSLAYFTDFDVLVMSGPDAGEDFQIGEILQSGYAELLNSLCSYCISIHEDYL